MENVEEVNCVPEGQNDLGGGGNSPEMENIIPEGQNDLGGGGKTRQVLNISVEENDPTWRNSRGKAKVPAEGAKTPPEGGNIAGSDETEVATKEEEEGKSTKTAVEEQQAKAPRPPDVKRERGVKICVRRLPSDMTKKDFIKTFEPLPAYNYLSINNPDKEWADARSVAWINFVNEEDAGWFMSRFQGYNMMDNRGSGYICSVDLANEPSVPKFVRYNKNRGTLVDDEHFTQFLLKLQEKKTGKSEEVVSVEKMLQEIESKAEKKKEPDNTPLLDFILKKKKDRTSSEKRDAKRRDRRDKENKERGNPDDKANRKERRRERDKKREKDRKERRVREKLEKEAQSKGMTITYSKYGKATRWSANSSPFAKKGTENEDSEKKEDVDKKFKMEAAVSDNQPDPSSSKSDGKEGKESERRRRARKEDVDKKFNMEAAVSDNQPDPSSFKSDGKEGKESERRRRARKEDVDKKFKMEAAVSDNQPDPLSSKSDGKEGKESERRRRARKEDVDKKLKMETAVSDNQPDPPSSKSDGKEGKESERRRRARPDMAIYRPGSFRSVGGSKREGGGVAK